MKEDICMYDGKQRKPNTFPVLECDLKKRQKNHNKPLPHIPTNERGVITMAYQLFTQFFIEFIYTISGHTMRLTFSYVVCVFISDCAIEHFCPSFRLNMHRKLNGFVRIHLIVFKVWYFFCSIFRIFFSSF